MGQAMAKEKVYSSIEAENVENTRQALLVTIKT
jgi:hypothetical protein